MFCVCVVIDVSNVGMIVFMSAVVVIVVLIFVGRVRMDVKMSGICVPGLSRYVRVRIPVTNIRIGLIVIRILVGGV